MGPLAPHYMEAVEGETLLTSRQEGSHPRGYQPGGKGCDLPQDQPFLLEAASCFSCRARPSSLAVYAILGVLGGGDGNHPTSSFKSGHTSQAWPIGKVHSPLAMVTGATMGM